MNEAVRLLLDAAMYVAPTSVEQAGFSDLVNRMRGGGCSQDSIVIELTSAIFAGVSRGAWPTRDDKSMPKESALEVLHMAATLAPDETARAGFTEIMRKMEQDKKSYADISLMLITTVSDGLRTGNWPRVEAKGNGRPTRA
jgi:hypothetical protein